MWKVVGLALLGMSLAGCYQTHSEVADLRAVPTTNNPLIVPKHHLVPGMGY